MIEEFYRWSSSCSTKRQIKTFCDNKAAVFFSKNNKSGGRSKHIDIKHLNMRENIKRNMVIIEHSSTDNMIIDPMTKRFTSKTIS